MDQEKLPTPSIGRIVHYYEKLPGPAYAAIITQTWSETCVNLTVFPPTGNSYSVTSCQHEHVAGDPANRRWVWPHRV